MYCMNSIVSVYTCIQMNVSKCVYCLLLILVNSFQVHRMIIYKHIIVVNIHVSKLVRIYSYHSLMCTGLQRGITQFQVQAVFVVRP
jgi:hypothetical protein